MLVIGGGVVERVGEVEKAVALAVFMREWRKTIGASCTRITTTDKAAGTNLHQDLCYDSLYSRSRLVYFIRESFTCCIT